MFGFLKKKLSKVVESISDRFKKKEEVAEEVKDEVEKIQPIIEEKPAKEAIEEIKILEEKIPELKEEIEAAVEEVKEELEPEIKTIEEKPKEKKSFFKRITEKIVRKVTEKKLSREELEPILDELGVDLIEADVAVEVVGKIKDDLKNSLTDKEIKRGKIKELVVSALRDSLLEILSVPEIDLLDLAKSKKPVTILFLGFNGSGKTTSLAKLGKWLIDNGCSCVFAAADTFRAASIEQLEEHAKKIGVGVIKHRYGADPAAVVYDAIEHAKAKNIDFVLADSAGRAHTNRNLMDQMQKIARVNKPDLKILVIDSLTGNDAVLQARMFNEVGVDALIFTKIDVNEKGGAVLSVTHELKKPILFLGLGQEYENLETFNPQKFVNNLFS